MNVNDMRMNMSYVFSSEIKGDDLNIYKQYIHSKYN